MRAWLRALVVVEVNAGACGFAEAQGGEKQQQQQQHEAKMQHILIIGVEVQTAHFRTGLYFFGPRKEHIQTKYEHTFNALKKLVRNTLGEKTNKKIQPFYRKPRMPTQCSPELSDHRNDRDRPHRTTTHTSTTTHTTLRVAILSPMTRLSGNLTTARRVARLIASPAFRAELFSDDVHESYGMMCSVEVQIIDCDGDSGDVEDGSSSISYELNGSTSSFGGPRASVTDRYRRGKRLRCDEQNEASGTSVEVDFDVCIVIHALRGMRAFHRLFRTVTGTTTSGGKDTSTAIGGHPADAHRDLNTNDNNNDDTAANSAAFSSISSTCTCFSCFSPFLTVPAGRVIVIFGGTDVNESTRQPRGLSEMTKMLTIAPTMAFPSYCGAVDTVAINNGPLSSSSSSSISFVSAFVCFSDEMKSDAIRLFPPRVVTEANAFVIPQSLDSEFFNHSRTHIKDRDDGKLGVDFVAAVEAETRDKGLINNSNVADKSSSGGGDPLGFILRSLVSGDGGVTCCRPCHDGHGVYNKGRDDITKKDSNNENGDNCDNDASLCCSDYNSHYSFVHMGGVRKVKGQRFALDAWRRQSLLAAAQTHQRSHEHIQYGDQNDSVRGEEGEREGVGGGSKGGTMRCCCCSCRTPPRSIFWLWLVGPLLEPSYWEDEVKPFVNCVVEVVDDNEEEEAASHDVNNTDAMPSSANCDQSTFAPHESGEHHRTNRNNRTDTSTMLGGLRVTSVKWLRPTPGRHGEGQAFSSDRDRTPSQESVVCPCGSGTSNSNNMLSHVVWLKGLPRRFVPLVFGSNVDSTFVVASPSPPSTTLSPFLSPSLLTKPSSSSGSYYVRHSHRVLALLNTSDSEGQPQAALECMAMGRIPVILRNVAGNRCVVRDDYGWKRAASGVNSPDNVHGEDASEGEGHGKGKGVTDDGDEDEIGNESSSTGFLVDTPGELADLIGLFSENAANGHEHRECSERDDAHFDEKDKEEKKICLTTVTERSNERKLLPAIYCDLPKHQQQHRGRREEFQVGCRVKHAEEYVNVYHSADSERSAYARLLRYVLFPPKV